MGSIDLKSEILVGAFELDGAPPDMPIVGLLLIVWREIAAMVDRESREERCPHVVFP